MELLHQYGRSLVFIVIMLEQLGLPIPAAPILILGGAMVAGQDGSLMWLLVVAAIGAFIGDIVWYIIGKKRGRGVLRMLCHISLSPDSCVRKTENSFLRHGMNSLLFAKFVPGLNTIAPPMAGMFSSSLFGFLWRDIAGIFIYCGAFILLGYYFEKTVFDVTTIFEELGRTFFWLILAGLAVWVASKYVKLKLLQRLLFKERITPEELYERMIAGEDLIIVDIRSTLRPAPAEGAIPGAIRIPPGEIDLHIPKLDHERWIIMYCT